MAASDETRDDERAGGPLTVDRLTAEIARLLTGAFPRVAVEGEVTSCRPSSSGHVYFTLRGQQATLGCTMWRSTAERLKRPVRDGDRVICNGAIDVYPPQGNYRLIVSAVRFAGEGELLQRLEQLKRKLYDEGLFAKERKRPLPFLPRRIGVVTSPSGAAVVDIIRSIHIRFPARILIAPTAVQGEGAHRQMILAIRALETIDDVDVIVIGRGGGSLEDLWEFNQEPLVRAIATSTRPVVSAVGHEIDTMLTDYVADVRAPTPTGVGELVVPELAALTEALEDGRRRARLAITSRLERARLQYRSLAIRLQDPRRLLNQPRLRVDDLEDRAKRAVRTLLARHRAALDALAARLVAAHPSVRMRERRTALTSLDQRLRRAWVAALTRARTRHVQAARSLETLSPVAVLGRGYAIVQHARSSDVIRSTGSVAPGDAVVVRVSDGRFGARVEREEDLP